MKVYIDGQYGTTGLQIHDRLQSRPDVELLSLPEMYKKDTEARTACMNEAEIVFLCLPDEAAREALTLITNPTTRVIDSSTAFRTDEAWVYGLPELVPDQREKIAASARVSVPGCHATAFVLSVNPLVQQGILPRDYPISYNSLTGYSGGGRPIIEQYQNASNRGDSLSRPQHYSLGLHHKHLPEMKKRTGLDYEPIFLPTVCDYYNGMVGTVPLAGRLLHGQPGLHDVHAALAAYYEGEPFVRVLPLDDIKEMPPHALDPTRCNGTNQAQIMVLGHDEQILVACRLDNLGKGSSGAAVQCMNLMLGWEEESGL
ncbi:N-acetyl-gamma-glutamyl-phosphate reductase [Paenibacillus daejeonensis]|uniref:N-acetyl-gamma-glutamyl-phosphate reductase n=1 Tax=Paenibacillus daejeonensis TaxID=135193 RepID=UPI00036DD9D5|nr:N-acetyl-gamma-glutamyl-phosphate reductase [Paenibacillus daejeonensis]